MSEQGGNDDGVVKRMRVRVADRGRRVAEAVRRADESPRSRKAVETLRDLLPGDRRYGDSLSTAGAEQTHIVGRRVAGTVNEQPSALRQAGLGALQLWQSVSEAQGRGRGDTPKAIAFTDLVGFSDWALEAGDDAAVGLLRDVGDAIEPEVKARDGCVVKWIGDGMMAVFDHPPDALEAIRQAQRSVAAIAIDGYDPRLRAGVHVGRPRRLGGDYFGVDVNIAARLADAAAGDEVVVSETALADLEEEASELTEKPAAEIKGVPDGLGLYVVAAETSERAA
ncbi:MAG: adenylate/guanylate cyclase domain-containing protein [Solirubrobacterales bacterium]